MSIRSVRKPCITHFLQHKMENQMFMHKQGNRLGLGLFQMSSLAGLHSTIHVKNDNEK